MDNDWGWNVRPEADAESFERVVPADGDPEVPLYRERMRRSQGYRPRYRIRTFGGSLGLTRRSLRWWLTLSGIAALVLLLIKPVLAIAAILVGLLVTFVVLGMLAVGALVFAVRFALGGRYPYDTVAGAGGRGMWQRLAWRALQRAWTRLARVN